MWIENVKLDRWPRWLQDEFAGMTPRAAFFFYVGTPLLCGLVLGWNRIAVGPYMTRLGSAGYWTVLVLMRSEEHTSELQSPI